MALKHTPQIQGGFRYAEPAYYLVNRVARDKLTGNIHGDLIVYCNEETRRAHQTGLQHVVSAYAAMQKADAALAAVQVPDGTPPEQHVDFIKARIERDGARALFGRAELLANSQDLQPGQTAPFVIPAGAAGDMIDGTAVDLVKVYAWLKSQPQFAGAEDA